MDGGKKRADPLIKDRSKRPRLQSPNCPNQTSCPMFAFVTVYEDGMIPLIQDLEEGGADHVFGDVVEWFLGLV